MTEAERGHLHVLASRTDHSEVGKQNVSPLRALIDGLSLAPAYIIDGVWNVLAENEAARSLFGTWSLAPSPNNNLLYRFFTDAVFTEHLEDWEQHAKLAVRQYRAVFARGMADQRFPIVIKAVAAVSPFFARWWDEADVAGRDHGRKVFRDSAGHRKSFDYVVLRPNTDQRVEVIAFLPSSSPPLSLDRLIQSQLSGGR
jgi:hypothetical protein